MLQSLLVLAALIPALAAQTQPIQIEVAAMEGTAAFETPGNPPESIQPGTTLTVGATIRTGPGSALDLFLGNTAGTLRLTQDTTLRIVKFNATTADTSEIEFHLTTGSVLGLGNRMGASNPYLIKVASGLLDTHARQFRINARGLVVGLDGSLVFAHISTDGSPKIHPLNCPPALYFWPDDGVKPAPPALIREVQGQLNARLSK